MAGEPESTEPKLADWMWTYTALVISGHALVDIVVVLVWRDAWPVHVWSVVLGVSSSALVALLAGLVTILVSWQTSRHFGAESNTLISESMRDALATTIESIDQLDGALTELLEYAAADSDRGVVLAVSDMKMFPSESRFVSALADRVRADLPSLIALPIGDQLKDLWPRLLDVVEPEADFLARLSKRQAHVIPVQSIDETVAVCLESREPATGFRFSKSVVAQGLRFGDEVLLSGARSAVSAEFASNAARIFCRMVSEPAATYGPTLITPDELAEGLLSGIPVTRSIITTQILWGASVAQRLKPTPNGTWAIPVVEAAGQTAASHSQFFYSSEQFLPPVVGGRDHSGAVVTQLVQDGGISVSDRKIWEIGCGPGYVTRYLAAHVDGGQLVATDIDERSLEICKANVDAYGSTAHVEYVDGDCKDFQVDVTPTASGTAQATITSPAGAGPFPVDLVFVELPLLPYKGARALTVYERGYLESADPSSAYLLPPSIRTLLCNLKPALEQKSVDVVLPVCAATDQELDELVGEVEALVGPGTSLTKAGGVAGDFVRVLLLGV